MDRLKEFNYNGKTLYYYEDDVTIGECSGECCVYAQDEDGEEYTIIFKSFSKREVIRVDY